MTTASEAPIVPAAESSSLAVSVVIPVLNEEQNLAAALASIRWADEVFVVDSGSTDRTADIAAAGGANVIQFHYSGQGPRKKSWALQHLPFANDWVLLLDADERVPEMLRREIAVVIATDEFDGYYMDRDFVFMDRALRCFRPNWNLRLFRTGRGRFEDLGLFELPHTGDNEIHEHIVVDGRTGFLKTPLLHDDYRGLSEWLERHNRYATWEAHLYRKFRREPVGVGVMGFLRADAPRRKRILRRVWTRVPGRPLLQFLVWYVARRGFLDGREGFAYSVLMSYHEFIIGERLRELDRGTDG